MCTVLAFTPKYRFWARLTAMILTNEYTIDGWMDEWMEQIV